MRNIFLFLRRYSNFLLFFFLEILSFYFIVHYNKYHEAMFGSMANRVTGRVNRHFNNAENYLKLKRTNDSLVKANEILYNKLKANYGLPDTASPHLIDTIKVDSLLQYQSFTYLSAKIISSPVSSEANYIVMYGKNVQQMRPGMGVTDLNNNVIGVVTEIDGDYAVVMSLLHKDSHLSAKLLKSGEIGTVNWDAESSHFLTLNRIVKNTRVFVGDSVTTSGLSAIFPKGLMIGRVDKIFTDPTSNFLVIRLRTAADFTNLEYGYAIAGKHQQQLKKIAEKIKAKDL